MSADPHVTGRRVYYVRSAVEAIATKLGIELNEYGEPVQPPAPRELTTPAEVDTLPLRAVVRSRGGSVVENAGGPLPWLGTGFTDGLASTDLDYPVTVLWPLPEAGQ